MLGGLGISLGLYTLIGPPIASHWASAIGLRAFAGFIAFYIIRWVIALTIGERGSRFWIYVFLQCASPVLIRVFVLVAERYR